MNLLQRQGFFNSITLYIGIALGFFNSIILFQRFLSLEEIGYYNLLIAISVIYTQVASLGFSSVITRYFPFYKSEDKEHKGFLSFVFIICLAGFIVVTLAFLFFKEVVFSFYEGKNGLSLMSRYYWYIIPISFLTLIFLIQETIARTVFKSIFPTFLREVLIKVSTAVGVTMIMLKWIDYKGFIIFYLFANLLIVFLITCYTYHIKIYKPTKISKEVRESAKPMLSYGLLSMISGSAIAIIPSIGLIILKMVSGEAMVGIYGTFFGIAAVISLPAKALNTTSYQIVAQAWKDEDLSKINKIYSKTSIVQLLIGTLLLIGLVVNQKSILFLLHKPIYAEYFNVFILLAFGYLIDITGGLNGAIISFSKQYKVVVRFLLITVFVCAIINYLLISSEGIVGAAWGYVATMAILNLGYWLYITLKFKMQPFGKKHFYTLVIGSISLIIGLAIPDLSNYYFDVLIRSSIVTIVYVALTYYLNISEDINDLLNKVLKKKSN